MSGPRPDLTTLLEHALEDTGAIGSTLDVYEDGDGKLSLVVDGILTVPELKAILKILETHERGH